MATTATELAELKESWDYFLSIPPGEVKTIEWWETAKEMRERIAQLEAALEVATFGWVILPDFGEPHCRYCRTLFHGTTPADHAADCPVRVLARS